LSNSQKGTCAAALLAWFTVTYHNYVVERSIGGGGRERGRERVEEKVEEWGGREEGAVRKYFLRILCTDSVMNE